MIELRIRALIQGMKENIIKNKSQYKTKSKNKIWL